MKISWQCLFGYYLLQQSFYLALFGCWQDMSDPDTVSESKKKKIQLKTLNKLKTKIANDGVYYTIIGCIIVANISLFCYGLWYQINAPIIGWSNYILPIGRGCGVTLELNCALILLPMCHSLLTLLRKLPIFVLIIPFDHFRAIHIFLANLIGIASGIHSIAQVLNYITASIIENPSDIWSKGIFSGGISLFVTGISLFFIVFIIILFAIHPIRKRLKFELFFYSHHLFILMYIILLIHGQRGGKFQFWKWFIIPGVLYIIDRLYRLASIHFNRRRCFAVSVKYFENAEVIKLEVPKVFSFKTGQFAEIIIPAISMSQRHPFTIASAPEDETMVFYIKKYGRWTSKLAKMAMNYSNRDKDLRVYIGGPFGAPAQFSCHYDHVVLIGTGIGATPFVSAMKHTNYICNNVKNQNLEPKFYKEESLDWAKEHVQTKEAEALFLSLTQRDENQFEKQETIEMDDFDSLDDKDFNLTDDNLVDSNIDNSPSVQLTRKSKRMRLYNRIYRTFSSLTTYICELWLIKLCILLEALDWIFISKELEFSPITIVTFSILFFVLIIMIIQVIFEIISHGGFKYFYSFKRVISLLDTPCVILLIVFVVFIDLSHRTFPYGVYLLFISLSLLFIILFIRLTLRVGAKNLLQIPSSVSVEFVQNLDFIWVNSTNNDIEWMMDDLLQLEHHQGQCENNCHLSIEKNLFITKEDPIEHDRFNNLSMNKGRPNWSKVIHDISNKIIQNNSLDLQNDSISNGKTIGVFFCGTPVVGDELRQLCMLKTAQLRQTSTPLYFIFHQEVF